MFLKVAFDYVEMLNELVSQETEVMPCSLKGFLSAVGSAFPVKSESTQSE